MKIGVVFMSFSNPTYHFRDAADFTVCTVCTICKVSCTFEMASRIWKWHENNTYSQWSYVHSFWQIFQGLSLLWTLEYLGNITITSDMPMRLPAAVCSLKTPQQWSLYGIWREKYARKASPKGKRGENWIQRRTICLLAPCL